MANVTATYGGHDSDRIGASASGHMKPSMSAHGVIPDPSVARGSISKRGLKTARKRK